MKCDDCRFCGGEKCTRWPRHLVVSALVPGQHLNVLETEMLQDLLNEAKLERVAPEHNGDQSSVSFEINKSLKKIG